MPATVTMRATKAGKKAPSDQEKAQRLSVELSRKASIGARVSFTACFACTLWRRTMFVSGLGPFCSHRVSCVGLRRLACSNGFIKVLFYEEVDGYKGGGGRGGV